MALTPIANFISAPSPDHPGWSTFAIDDPTLFNSVVMGQLLIRTESERSCRLRMFPVRHHSNVLGAIHGGMIMALADVSLFAVTRLLLAADAAGSVTLDMSTQFIGGGRLDAPLDVVTEVLRETGRLVFVRGLLEQEGQLVAAFSASIRKPTRRN
jgi:hypothetical protein